MADNSEKYFLKWVNYKLRPRSVKIENIAEDFSDGIKLVTLLEQLSGVKNTTRMVEPKNEIFKLQNLNVAMTMAVKMVKNLQVNGRNFISGTPTDVKLILGFIFDLVLHYQVDDIDMDGLKGKEGLLMWCQKNTANHDGVSILNFSTSWKDGMGFLALVHTYNNACVNYAEEYQKYADGKSLPADQQLQQAKERIDKAIRIIQAELGVEQIIDADFAEMPSDKANITYLSLIFKAFSNKKKNNKSIETVNRTIQRAIQVEELKQQLLTYIQQYKDDVEAAKLDLKIEPAQTESEIQDQIKVLFKKDREYNAQFQLDIGRIDDSLETLNQTRFNFGQVSPFRLEGENSLENLAQLAQALHAQNLSTINDLRSQINKQFTNKMNEKKDDWKKLFEQFAKADEAHNNISREEMEQLLMASNQAVEPAVLDNMYAEGRKVTFEDFVELMDALENDRDTDEQCILAFSQLCGGLYVTVSDLQKAGTSENDIKWLTEHMPEIDDAGKQVTKISDEKMNKLREALKSIKPKGGIKGLEKMNKFVAVLATQVKRVDVPGEKKYDYVKFIQQFYE
ncbi:Calponin_homology (CH) domain-containing protein [Hexamita inflata]|uniref:Calponin_homology (CH) domain-containing protein n=1 Tax=Hexamita inflata TaxID=28002 RepID=A0ABP1GJ77_9EUKA